MTQVPDEAHSSGPALGMMEIQLALADDVTELWEWVGGSALWQRAAIPSETSNGTLVTYRFAVPGGGATFFRATVMK